jgi:hypothetical protein
MMKVHLCLQFSQSAIVRVLHQMMLELALGKWFVFHVGILVSDRRELLTEPDQTHCIFL